MGIEYDTMSVCPKWNGCSAPLCPLDPDLYAGRHWYTVDDVCARKDMGKHPMVKAQRRIMRRKDRVNYGDHEFSVHELMERGRKKRVPSPASLEALARFRETSKLERLELTKLEPYA